MQPKINCVIITDFNPGNLTNMLQADDKVPLISVTEVPFDQVIPTLLEPKQSCWNSKPDYAIVWTHPCKAIPSFRNLHAFEEVSVKQILKEVDTYASAIITASNRVRALFVPLWTLPANEHGLGLLDMDPVVGASGVLLQMNLQLIQSLNEAPNIFPLNAQKWIEDVDCARHNPKLWYRAKIPFTDAVFKNAIKDIKSAINGLLGRSKKLIILDLDNTLWGGIVGEDGWQNLQIGGHSYRGEVYADFQTTLKTFTNRGIILGIVSKNDETTVLNAICNNPEMILTLKDFAAWRINWNDKAQNIIDLTNELNLGLDTVVFFDDSLHERERVRSELPEVLVPELPEDPAQYKTLLTSLQCFSTPSLSEEDRSRNQTYVAEKERKKLRKEVSSIEDWITQLGVKVTIEAVNSSNLKRVTQLLNKSNQMNLSTRRLQEVEVSQWLAESNQMMYALRVTDNLSSSGITGVSSLKICGSEARIVDFVLSCRVFGRQIEYAMIHLASMFARKKGAMSLIAEIVDTPKNSVCRQFFEGLDFEMSNNAFTLQLSKPYPAPKCIEIINDGVI